MKKTILNQINAVVLEVLYRGFRVLYRDDTRVREEIDSWPAGLTMKLVCGPGGAVLAIRKDADQGIGRLKRAQRTDITMRFKSVEGAFKLLSGQLGVAEGYAKHLFSLEGDIFQTMSFVRCVDYLEAYLFPEIMTKRILKEVPEKQVSSMKVYAQMLTGRL